MVKKKITKKTRNDNKKEELRTKMDKEAMIKALEKSLGVVTTACRSVGISRQAHYVWLKEDPEYKKSVDDCENIALDFAESKLHSQIQDNNPTSTIFFLKTKGKKRGYIERVEQEMSGGIEVKNVKSLLGESVQEEN